MYIHIYIYIARFAWYARDRQSPHPHRLHRLTPLLRIFVTLRHMQEGTGSVRFCSVLPAICCGSGVFEN